MLLDPLQPWDLTQLCWGLNWSGRAGRGLGTAQLVRFDGGREGFVSFFGPDRRTVSVTSYSLGDDGLKLHSNFGVHHVRREPSGEWSIRNHMMNFISAAAGTALLDFPDKYFIGLGEPPPPPAFPPPVLSFS